MSRFQTLCREVIVRIDVSARVCGSRNGLWAAAATGIRRGGPAVAGLLTSMCVLVSAAGCGMGGSANWFKNGLLDPSQVGNFEKSVSNEIRESISILEEPTGIQNAEEPTAADVTPSFVEQPIQPGDALNVSMFEVLTPGMATTLQIRVGNSGFETIPVVGQVRVVGLTPRELELELKERLREAGVLADADVQVSLLMSQAAQFSIVGNVARPNTYPLPRPGYRLLEAIAAAGGIPPQVEKIYVFRVRSEAGASTESPKGDALAPSPDLASAKSHRSRTAPSRLAGVDWGHKDDASRRGKARDAAGIVAYTMSETSSGRSGKSQDEPPPQTAPAATERVIDELEILEGQPSGEVAAPWWDAERGEWVLQEPQKQPPTPATQESRVPPRAATEPEVTTTTASAAAPVEAPEEQPWAEAPKEMGPPLRIIEIPVKELLDGDTRYNICIRPFDTINVPEGMYGEYYLGGNVARAGAYTLTGRRITVKQAIVSAGGLGPLAWPGRAEVVRRVGKDEEQIIQLDLDAIFAGTAPDFYVKPNDIVNVGTNAATVFMAVLRNAFRLSYGMGFVYDRNFADDDTWTAKEAAKNRHNQERLQRGLPL